MNEEDNVDVESEEKKSLNTAMRDAKKLGKKAEDAKTFVTIVKAMNIKKTLITIGIVLIIVIVIVVFLAVSDYHMNKTTYETTSDAQTMGNADPYSEDYLQTLKDDGANLDYLNDEEQEALQNGAKASESTTQINLEQKTTSRINNKFRNIVAANFDIPYKLNGKITTDSPLMYSSVRLALNSESEGQVQENDSTDDQEDIIGVITIYRASMGEESKRIFYKPYDEFMQLVNDNNQEVLEYFSIKNDKLVVADWHTKEVRYDTSDNMPESEKAKYKNTGVQYEEIEVREISYKDFIGAHALSFDFMLSLLVITKDEGFINALAETAKESDLRFTIFDNITETVTTEKQKFVETTEYEKWVSYQKKEGLQFDLGEEEIKEVEGDTERVNDESIDVSSKDVLEYTLTTTTIDKVSSYTFGLTFADSWLAKETTEYNYDERIGDSSELESGDVVEYDPIVLDKESIDNINNDSDIIAYRNNKVNSQENWNKFFGFQYRKYCNYENWSATQQRTITKTSQVTENNIKTNSYSYSKGKQTIENEGEKFKELYDTYPATASMLRVADTQILDLLESTTEGSQYISIFKYLLYKCTGTDYGVTEEDIRELINLYNVGENFVSFFESGDTLEWALSYIHYVEAGVKPMLNAEGTKYVAIDDGVGVPTVGYGVNISANYNRFKKIAGEMGININIESLNYMGAEIDKELVDAVEQAQIEEKMNDINNKYPELEIYQKYALLSQIYQKGSLSDNFDYYYKNTWKQEKDLEYGSCSFSKKDAKIDSLTVSDKNAYGYFDDELCQNGFFPNWQWTINNRLGGIRKRRRADYIMFKSGWNMVTHSYCPIGDSTSSVNTAGLPKYNAIILEKALWLDDVFNKNNFEYHELYNYSGGGNTYHPMINSDGSVNKSNAIYINGSYRISCASFVTEVLKQAGIYSGSRTIWAWKDANTMISRYKTNGIIVEEVSPQDALPGDIIFNKYNVHTNILTEKTATTFKKTGSPEFKYDSNDDRHYRQGKISRLNDWVILRVKGKT